MKRKLILIAVAVSIVLASAVIALLAATSSKATSLGSKTIAVHTLTNVAGQQLAVWSTPRGVDIAVANTGFAPTNASRETVTVAANTLTYASGGRVFEKIRYVGNRGPWQVVRDRFLASKAQIMRALRSGGTARLLAAASSASDDPGPTTMTNVTDYGTNTTALKNASPFAILGAIAINGHALVDAYSMSVSDLYHHVQSGDVVALQFDAPQSLAATGAGDSISVNIAPTTSNWGQRYAQMMTSTAANDDGSVPINLTPTVRLVNPYQLLVLSGSTYVSITTTTALTPTAARAVAALLHRL